MKHTPWELTGIVVSLLTCTCATRATSEANISADVSAKSVSALEGANPTTISSFAYGLVLDASGASTTDGTPILEWSPNGGANQQWNLVPQSAAGVYTIVNVNSGKCLDVIDGDQANGTLLQQWDCWGGSNQAWLLVPTRGAFEIVSQASGRCIDAPLGITQAGVRPQIWDCGGADNQLWQLTNSTTQPTPTPSPTSASTAPPAQFTLSVTQTYGGSQPVFVRQGMYDYAPSVIQENGVYRMWWCASVPYEGGDHIFHAEATSLDGPWHAHNSSQANTADDVFQPTYSANDWDGQDTCDPSVLHVNGTYYMWYGGFPIANTPPTQVTAIGLAQSSDGLSFTRVSNTPIIYPARNYQGLPNPYGAGQPSVIYYNSMFYMAYTDTTGVGSNSTNGAGIFVLRSSDPKFASNVEEFNGQGFFAYNTSSHTTTPIIQGFTVDWAYSDAMRRFFMVFNTGGTQSNIYVFDENLQSQAADLSIAGVTYDGPGIAAGPDHHIASAACNEVRIDTMRAVSDGTGATGPYSWDLGHAGVDLTAGYSCSGP